MEQRVFRRLRRSGLGPDSSLILGFSGGPDSLSLALLLRRLAPSIPVRVVAVHVDHGLRPGSHLEQGQAGALAQAAGLPFRAERVSAFPLEVHPGVGIEEAARRERFRILARTAREEGAAAVCLAHHQQDQAETVLLHLLRGAGLTGAAGMTEWSTLTVPWWPEPSSEEPYMLGVWRPLLDEKRESVRSYAVSSGLIPINDPSNTEDRFLRNLVRHEALPVLERVRPGATAALARFAALAGSDDAALDALAADVLKRIRDSEGRLEIRGLLREAEAVRRRVVRQWLAEAPGFELPSLERSDAVLSLAARGAGDRFVEAGGDRIVTVVGAQMVLGDRHLLVDRVERDFGGPLFPEGCVAPVRMRIPGTVRIGGDELMAEPPSLPREGIGGVPRGEAAVVLAGDEVDVRPPRPGDRWARSGRRLGDWLTGRKVPTLIRGRLVCIATGHSVHAVAGLPVPAFELPDKDVGGIVRLTTRRWEEA